MSSLIYPTLPGLTFNSIRSPHFNTGKQQALTGKESRIAYQQWPLWNWELIYEYLSVADLQAIQGLFIAVQGDFDTFLYSDPIFNSVTAQQFAVVASTDTTSTIYQITAVYQNVGGPGGAELIQNFNGTPLIYGNGTLISATHYTISGTGGVTFSTLPTTGTVLTWTGSFYYRVRFDNDDSMDASQFMQNMFEIKKIKLHQVKL